MKLFIEGLQRQGILPSGKFECTCWELPASDICKVDLSDGYFIKKIKVREGAGKDNRYSLDKQYAREYEALQLLKPMFSLADDFSIPDLVYGDPESLTIITKALYGQQLQEVCSQYARRFGRIENNADIACFNVGRFLRYLHSLATEEFSSESLDSLVCYIRQRITSDNFSDFEIKHIYAHLDAIEKLISNNLGGYIKSPVHHDLNPTNILVDGEKINVVDFSDFSMDSPYQDLVYFPLMLHDQLGSTIIYRHQYRSMLLARFYAGYGCDLSTLKNDDLYNLYVLKNLSIFIMTYAQLIKGYRFSQSLLHLKDRLLLECDLRRVRKLILTLVG